jgi:hypothetical protein
MEAHTVPRVYLKNFASKHGLVVIDLTKPIGDQVRAQALTDVNDVSTRPDHYAFQRSTGQDNVFEDAFQRIETETTKVMKRVKGGALSAHDRLLLAWIAATQEARSERSLTSMEDVLEKRFSEIRSSVEAASGDDGAVAAAIAEYIKRDVYDGDAVTDAANLTRLTITTTLETSATMYSIMNMCVLKSTAHYFVTSDHPVVWIDPRVFGRADGNRLSVTAEVTYPLTKQHCLLMSYMPIRAQANAEQDVVSIINGRTSAFARGEVYLPPAGTSMHQILIADLNLKNTHPAALGPPLSSVFQDPNVATISVRDIAKRIQLEQSVVDAANADVIEALRQRGLGDFSEHGARCARTPRPS